jgi:hypothetical protein
MKIDMNSENNMAKIYNENEKKKDKSKISIICKLFNIRSAKEIIKLEKLESSNIKGIMNLIRLRTGSVSLTNKLCALKIIPNEYKDKCMMCNNEIKEDLVHCILSCPAYADERKKFIKVREIKKQLNTEILEDNTLMSVILGGDDPNHFRIFRMMHSGFLLLINSIMRKRAIKTQELRTTEA